MQYDNLTMKLYYSIMIFSVLIYYMLVTVSCLWREKTSTLHGGLGHDIRYTNTLNM